MKYSIEKMHEQKYGRQSGKTVDAVADIIGKIMVTENTTFPFIIKRMDRSHNIRKTFEAICIDHFDIKPKKNKIYTLEIEGYSSKATFITIDRWNDFEQMTFSPDIIPTFDLD